jgi:hypothetical protein
MRLRLALQTQLSSARVTAAARETALRHTAEAAQREADAHAARAAQAERELSTMRARTEEAERRYEEVDLLRAAEASRAEGAERGLEELCALLRARKEVGPALWDAVRMLGALADEATRTF